MHSENPEAFADKYTRQQDIVPAERLAECSPTVIGVGAIGRQVALQLAAIGVPRLKLIDFDTVEQVNLAAQGFWEKDLGRAKVEATAEHCRMINSTVEIDAVCQRFRRSEDIGDVVFCCVDSIETRRMIFRAVRDRCRFFADGRMSAEVLRVLIVCDERGRGHYPQTLFQPAEAHAGPCTARTTIYCANIAAGLMVSCFTRWLRGLPVEPDVSVNLLAAEMSVAE
ncbi:MAG: HesA/MoeB/ThiF family protein [Phycisphaerae bacterium]